MGSDNETLLLTTVMQIKDDMGNMRVAHEKDMSEIKADIAVLKQRSQAKAAIWGGISGGATLIFGTIITYLFRK